MGLLQCKKELHFWRITPESSADVKFVNREDGIPEIVCGVVCSVCAIESTGVFRMSYAFDEQEGGDNFEQKENLPG